MSEYRALSLVAQCPNPVALARRARDNSVFAALRHLERRGYLWQLRGEYRLTSRGREELAMSRALLRLAAQSS